MTTTVHVSRTFTVNRNDTQVLEELRLLAARGFAVLGPLDLTPVADVVVEAEPEKNRVAEICDELSAGRGLGAYKVAALIGVTSSTIYNWTKSRTAIPANRLDQLEQLLKRSRALPAGSTTLYDEASVAIAARRRVAAKPRAKPLSDETRLEIAVLREQGLSIREIKKSLGVGAGAVYRALKDLGAV